MTIWHLTPDAPRLPHRVSLGERIELHAGTWPVANDQLVWATLKVRHSNGSTERIHADATWQRNDGANSYWVVHIGPFAEGDVVTYTLHGQSPNGVTQTSEMTIRVGPKLYLAILWHQHQPLYKDLLHRAKDNSERSSYLYPWVRLHAIRDYFSMAALVGAHPDVHFTINLTPSLMRQIEDYIERGATDRSLELTLKPAESLDAEEREQVLADFFDADWHNQIFPHPRYKALFTQRWEGRPFTIQDLRDLQMWFNLAWFGQEFRDGDVTLPDGQVASVRRFVAQGRDFSTADIQAMVAEQLKIMRAIRLVYSALQARGQIEISTTPFYHPILPLLVDTDRATLDRPGTAYPVRFMHREDAQAQVAQAVEHYKHCFGRAPRGMWPAEGAVSQSVIPLFAFGGARWIATDRGVLARSGKWGYQADNPNVLCQPYRVEDGGSAVSVFFRDTALSDAIGFRYQAFEPEKAAHDFLREVKERFAHRLEGDADHVLSVILDGENAWGAYREDARPFLHALYELLERDVEVRTVTFSEYLDGNPVRGIAPHPLSEQTRVHDLFTGSWIDENASGLGVDLGTWIGEGEENRGWELLGQARNFLTASGASQQTAPTAFDALYAAEGSDWFWWFGDDQDSGNDPEFDDLFRLHLKTVYRAMGAQPPLALDRNIVPHTVLWTFTQQVPSIQPGDRLRVRTHCPGLLTWQVDDAPALSASLTPVGGVMAGTSRHHITLGPFPPDVREVRFRFRCTHPNCDGKGICCRENEHHVTIARGGQALPFQAQPDVERE